jgi:hypothetical protein
MGRIARHNLRAPFMTDGRLISDVRAVPPSMLGTMFNSSTQGFQACATLEAPRLLLSPVTRATHESPFDETSVLQFPRINPCSNRFNV